MEEVTKKEEVMASPEQSVGKVGIEQLIRISGLQGIKEVLNSRFLFCQQKMDIHSAGHKIFEIGRPLLF